MAGEKYGKYEIHEKIGQGGMGSVFRARDPILKRDVAIKTISANLDGDDELRQRFEREAQLAANLNHPNIISIFDFGEERGQIYMAMELLKGFDLKDAIKRGSLKTLDDKLSLVEDICVGLGFAHARGVIHRDLKPANIHIQPDGLVKIMDFGLARLQSSDMTRTGMMMGTPDYMAPEQIQGGKADARSDIYSMGALFYEILAKQRPFKAENTHGLLFQVLYKHPIPIGDLVPELPESVRILVMRCLSKEPDKRFQHGDEMRDAIRAARQAIKEGPQAEATLIAEFSSSEIGETVVAASPVPLSGSPGTPPSGPAMPSGGLGAPTPHPSGAPGSNPTGGYAATPGSGGVVVGGTAYTTGGPTGQTIIVQGGSKAPMYIVSAIAVLAIAFISLYMTGVIGSGSGAAEQERAAQAQLQLVDTWMGVARDKLSNHDYPGAIAQAEKILAKDPNHVAAKAVVTTANESLAALDTKAAEANAAFDSGDTEKASKLLSELGTIAPDHPAVVDLSSKLNSVFQGKADTARSSMQRAQRTARSAGAADLAGFSSATQIAGEGDALFQSSDFAMAAMKFSSATIRFQQSETDARTRGRDRAARSKQDRQDQANQIARDKRDRIDRMLTGARNKLGTGDSAGAKAQAELVLEEEAGNSAARKIIADAQAAIDEASKPKPIVTPPETAKKDPVRQPDPAPVPVDDKPAIRQVMRDYKRAIESKNLELFRTIKPNLSQSDQDKLKSSFRNVKKWEINLDIEFIEVTGSNAKVTVTRKDTIDGRANPPRRSVFSMTKERTGWKIVSIR